MAFQETMIAPIGVASMAEAVQMGSEVFQHLKKVIVEHFGSAGESFLTFGLVRRC